MNRRGGCLHIPYFALTRGQGTQGPGGKKQRHSRMPWADPTARGTDGANAATMCTRMSK